MSRFFQQVIAAGRQLQRPGDATGAEQICSALEALYRNEPDGAAVLTAAAQARRKREE